MTTFTFTTKEVRDGITNAEDNLIDESFDMPQASSAHLIQIYEELDGAELAALPYDQADVDTSGDPFMDLHGVCRSAAAEMLYFEHARPHLRQRGCGVIANIARYLVTTLKPSVEGTPDAETLIAASRRMMEVHLVHIHNIPAGELKEIADLVEHHQEILKEFYATCIRPPFPGAH